MAENEQFVGALHAQEAQKAVAERVELVGEFPPKPVTRRDFMMSWAGLSWLTFSAASGVGLAATARFMLPRVLFEPPQIFKAGILDDFEWDRPSEKFKLSHSVWIVKKKNDFDNKSHLYALSTVCTHLGCTPNLLETEKKIKCPCHGSGFYYTGINFEGPAPRPLERYKVYVDPVDGKVVVDKTKKFQYEKQQWVDPDSYVDLSLG